MNHKSLHKELQETINRIPKDLVVWRKFISKLKHTKRTPKQHKALREYQDLKSFYEGKMMAYIYVVQRLFKGKLYLTTLAMEIIKMMFKNSQPIDGKKPKLRKISKRG